MSSSCIMDGLDMVTTINLVYKTAIMVESGLSHIWKKYDADRLCPPSSSVVIPAFADDRLPVQEAFFRKLLILFLQGTNQEGCGVFSMPVTCLDSFCLYTKSTEYG